MIDIPQDIVDALREGKTIQWQKPDGEWTHLTDPSEMPVRFYSSEHLRVKPESVVRYMNVYPKNNPGGFAIGFTVPLHGGNYESLSGAKRNAVADVAGHIKYTITDGKLTDVEIVE